MSMDFLKNIYCVFIDHRLKSFVFSLIIVTLLISGCTDQNVPDEHETLDSINLSNVTSFLLESHEVQLFLTQYPNASITASFVDNNDIKSSSDDIDLNSADASIPIYTVSIQENNSSIVSWFNQDDEIIKKEFQNPLIFNDTSDRILYNENFTFNIVKIDSDIYVTFTGSTKINEIDYLIISGTNALSHDFETQYIGNKDSKPDEILFNTVKLEDACPTCWRNLIMVRAIFTNEEKETVLKAQI